MEYKIESADSVHQLEERVNDAIAVGWRPLGGVSATFWQVNDFEPPRSGTTYCQAMTR
ncbi:DUF1737 domain-containing protein [Ruegeria arenilitoris]|uniref:DUF1737 domain-containing protein n=1 Tax=Ruegeria arenilitoris TaxID=1173585 RepID=UPI003C7B5B5E